MSGWLVFNIVCTSWWFNQWMSAPTGDTFADRAAPGVFMAFLFVTEAALLKEVVKWLAK